MSNSSSGLIYEAVPKVIADVGAVGKDKINRQQGFKYRSVDDVFNALNPALAKNGVFIVPLILQRECTEVGKTSKGATIVKVMLKVKFTFYASDGSHIETIIYGEAMDMGTRGQTRPCLLHINMHAFKCSAFLQKKCKIRMQTVLKKRLSRRQLHRSSSRHKSQRLNRSQGSKSGCFHRGKNHTGYAADHPRAADQNWSKR